MSRSERSRVVRLSELFARIPGPAGEHAVTVLKRGTLDVALSAPSAPVQQTPHAQDEVYVVVRGRGVLSHDGKRDPIEEGDLLFVAAGVEHQIVETSENFAVWRIFYGEEPS